MLPKPRFAKVQNIAVTLLAVALILLEAADVLSTYHMLARGGREQNPIVLWFMQTLGDAWPLCKLPEVAVIVLIWALAPRPVALLAFGLMTGVYGYVVWHNYHI
jgi:Domain of unknown function (DUF5658)